jgi:hypothetical protein
MNDRFFPENRIRNLHVTRPVSAKVLLWLAIIAVVGTLVSSGFVISARQHFKAMMLGYESESFRKQADELEEKLRRLELERARYLSPLELERRAKQMGLEQPASKRTRSAKK